MKVNRKQTAELRERPKSERTNKKGQRPLSKREAKADDPDRPRFAKLLERPDSPRPAAQPKSAAPESKQPTPLPGETAKTTELIEREISRTEATYQRTDDQRTEDKTHREESGAVFAADGVRESSTSRPAANVEQAARPERDRAEAVAVFHNMLERLQTSEDARARKTVVMQLDAGARGRVAVRIRRDGDAFEVRMRATDASFGDELRAHQGDLARAASKKGLRFSRVEVIS